MRAVLALQVSVGQPAPPTVVRRSRAAGRARRWDTGPVPTARDLTALRFVGEQYAVRLDVATVLLTQLSATGPERGSQLSRRAVREQLGRWEQAGWAERRRLLGHTWVTLTRTGLQLCGLDYEVWSPALDRLDHHHAAAVVRLHRESIPGQGGWCVSGRCGGAAARLRGIWPTPPCPHSSLRAGRSRGLARRGSSSRSSFTRRPAPARWPPSRPARRTPRPSPTPSRPHSRPPWPHNWPG